MRGLEWVACGVAVAACGPAVAEPGSGQSDGAEMGSSASVGSTGDATASGGVTSSSSASSPGTAPPLTDLPPDVPPETTDGCAVWADMGCTAPALAVADVSGDTPVGSATLRFAAFASHTGCGACVEAPNVALIMLVAEAADLGPDGSLDEVVTIEVDPFEGPVGDPMPVIVTADVGGSVAVDAGTLTLDAIPTVADVAQPFDPDAAATISGLLVVDADGWSLSGSFTAGYCPARNAGAICE